MVSEGDSLARLVPGGRLMLAAEFDPAEAVGRIRAGQRAWLHLAGFPSIQYGSVPAQVDLVGGEVREGRVRVELSIRPDPNTHIAFEHGLPGAVEVEVERVTPAMLVLRAAGQLLAPTRGEAPERPSQAEASR
jgi:membrane fusion protein (multidrug efflux system)